MERQFSQPARNPLALFVFLLVRPSVRSLTCLCEPALETRRQHASSSTDDNDDQMNSNWACDLFTLIPLRSVGRFIRERCFVLRRLLRTLANTPTEETTTTT